MIPARVRGVAKSEIDAGSPLEPLSAAAIAFAWAARGDERRRAALLCAALLDGGVEADEIVARVRRGW